MEGDVLTILLSRSAQCEVLPPFTSREFELLRRIARKVCSAFEQDGFGPCEFVRIGVVSGDGLEWAAATEFCSLVGTVCLRTDKQFGELLGERSGRVVELVLAAFPILPRGISVIDAAAPDVSHRTTILIESVLCGVRVVVQVEFDSVARGALAQAARKLPMSPWQRLALKRAIAPHGFELLVRLPIDALRRTTPERNYRVQSPVLAVLRGPPSLHEGSDVVRGDVSVRSGDGEFELVFESREGDGSASRRV